MGMCVLQAAAGQEALEKKVGMLETHQKEIHDALLSMENEASRLYQVGGPYFPQIFSCSSHILVLVQARGAVDGVQKSLAASPCPMPSAQVNAFTKRFSNA